MMRNEVMVFRSGMLVAVLGMALAVHEAGCFPFNEGNCVGCEAGQGGASSTSSTGGAGGAALNEPENCIDGVDNNSDSVVDCADPQCISDFECVNVPEGWNGPLLVEVAPYGSVPEEWSDCPYGSQSTIYYADPNDEPQCAECECSDVGVSCSAPRITCNFGPQSSAPCLNMNEIFVITAEFDTCIADPSNGWESGGCVIEDDSAYPINGSSCVASGGEMINLDPWQNVVRVCNSASEAGCGEGEWCAPRNKDSGSLVCVKSPDATQCPDGWKHADWEVFEGVFVDTRNCAGCSCNLDGIECVGGSYEAFDLNGCAAPGNDDDATVTIDSNSCTDVSSVVSGTQFSLKPQFATRMGSACIDSTSSGTLDTYGRAMICCRAPN